MFHSLHILLGCGLGMSALKKFKKSKRGVAVCEVCDENIKVGEYYYKFSVRFAEPRIRCKQHRFRQSDMAQGRNADVYAVREQLEDWINGECSHDVIRLKQLLDDGITDLERIADEYDDSASNIAEHFGDTLQTQQMEDNAEQCREMLDSLTELNSELADENGLQEIVTTENIKNNLQQSIEIINF
jgi:hypothetical protein